MEVVEVSGVIIGRKDISKKIACSLCGILKYQAFLGRAAPIFLNGWAVNMSDIDRSPIPMFASNR